MEVHAHPLTSAGRHKKWTHYLWEFLMLFLAVFCGFLAENQREHYVEKQRARDYALSLYRDIKADTIIFNETINSLKLCITNIDSLVNLLEQPDDLKKHIQDFYKYNAFAFIFPMNKPNEATLQQLINSGSLRYLTNTRLVDSIKLYSMVVQLFNNFAQTSNDFNIEFRKILPDVLDVKKVIEFSTLGADSLNNQIMRIGKERYFNNDKSLKADAGLLKKYAGWCALKQFYFENTIAKYADVETTIGFILRTIENEYGIK